MKKILFFGLAALCAVGCKSEPKPLEEFSLDGPVSPDYYCQMANGEVYDDAKAEFDTLSYALGMNLGISINVQQADMDLDADIIAKMLRSEALNTNIDNKGINQNRKHLNEFSAERVRPFMMQKRMTAYVETDQPDTIEQPVLYDDTYRRDEVSEWFGRDMAEYIRSTQVPVNLTWLMAGYEDSKSVKSVEEIDSLMALTTTEMRAALDPYFRAELPKKSREASEAWLAEVATKPDVQPLVVGADTLYYRIDEAGGEVKPADGRDTITMRFEMFTRRGTLVESTVQRGADRRDEVAKRVEKLQQDTLIDPARRDEQIEALNKSVDFAFEPNIMLSRFTVRGAIEALKQVGEGGRITIWMPSSLAYGPRGNRAVLPNEAIVMSVRLVDVVPYISTDAAKVTPKFVEPKEVVPGKPSIKREGVK